MCEISTDSYLADSARIQVVTDFLKHEAAKPENLICKACLEVVASRTSESHADLLSALRSECLPTVATANIAAFIEKLSLPQRWKLFHAVSCGVLEKDLFNCVGHPERTWILKPVLLSRARFETPVGALREMCEGSLTFGNAVAFLRKSGAVDLQPHALQDPLLGRATDNQYILIHDGNGRLLSYAFALCRGKLDEDHQIDIWVGNCRNPSREEMETYHQACKGIFWKPPS